MRRVTRSACHAALAAATIGLAWTGHLLAPWWVIAWAGALFVPYFALLRAGHHDLRVVVATALAARLGLCFAPVLLSDDIFRYVWDGVVAAQGINPYRWPPTSPELASLRDASIWPFINHPDLVTIYPPVGQYVFTLNAWLGATTTSLKLLFVGVECLSVWWIWGVLRARWSAQRAKHALALYALNPLVMLEVAWSGHVDVVAWCTLACALVSATEGGVWAHARTGALLGLSVAAKFLGLMLLPLLIFAPKPPGLSARRAAGRRALLALSCVAVFAGSYVPYLSLGTGVFGSLGTYASSWRTNDSVFRVVEGGSRAIIRATAPPKNWVDPASPHTQGVVVRLEGLNPLFEARGWTKQWEGKQLPDTTKMDHQISATIGKVVAALCMGLMLLWCLLVVRDPFRGALLLWCTLYLVAPTVMPWYLAWLVPLAALKRCDAALAWSALGLLAYSAWASFVSQGPWRVPDWAIALECAGLVCVAWWSARRARRALDPEQGPVGGVHAHDVVVGDEPPKVGVG